MSMTVCSTTLLAQNAGLFAAEMPAAWITAISRLS
jgi:hypothetical protein